MSCAQFVEESPDINVARYVDYALNNNVRVLLLTVNADADMPGEIFNCPSLEELEICVYKGRFEVFRLGVAAVEIVFPPRLKNLHLKGDGLYINTVQFGKLIA